MKAKLIKKSKEADSTYSFFFELTKPIHWLPGQFIYLTLPQMHFKDSRGSTRHMTISSSPTEGGILRVTTRIRDNSGFKKTLIALEKDDTIEVNGPSGTFILDENESGSHVFIVGGIGITPFRSFLIYKKAKNLKCKVKLIVTNHSKTSETFRNELDNLAKKDKDITIFRNYTKIKDGKRLDEGLLRKMLIDEEISSSTFWVAGPPKMVSDIEDILMALNIKADNIRLDKFTGY